MSVRASVSCTLFDVILYTPLVSRTWVCGHRTPYKFTIEVRLCQTSCLLQTVDFLSFMDYRWNSCSLLEEKLLRMSFYNFLAFWAVILFPCGLMSRTLINKQHLQRRHSLFISTCIIQRTAFQKIKFWHVTTLDKVMISLSAFYIQRIGTTVYVTFYISDYRRGLNSVQI